MTSYEERLRDLAEGGLWGMPNLNALITSVDEQRRALEKVIGNLPEYWKGQSGSVLILRLKQHAERLKAFATFLHAGQQQVTGNGQFSCSAN